MPLQDPDMEPFIVSARKYRPQQFEDVVGQQSITRTLLNAIEKNHLAQALLFCGPRGVGKTTCARILAKKINEDGSEQEGEDFAFNIFELDAASNNSVDDIRNLIDQVRIPPQVGKYKVYIIDEVHMCKRQFTLHEEKPMLSISPLKSASGAAKLSVCTDKFCICSELLRSTSPVTNTVKELSPSKSSPSSHRRVCPPRRPRRAIRHQCH